MLTTSPTLLDKLRQRDQFDAWKRFVELYTPLFLIWANRQGLHGADADDAAQDVLLKLIESLPRYEPRPGHTFRGWLFTVASNQCRDFRRRIATRPLPVTETLDHIGEDQVFDLEESEYRAALVRRGLELIRTDFGEGTWAAFTGVMLEGRPAAEVAAQLGLTANAVYTARHRVLVRLRTELSGLLD